jgi:hypothetical protein
MRACGCELHSRRVVSGLKAGTQPHLAPETDDPIVVMREGKPPVGGAVADYYHYLPKG